ncbi:MAG: MotA/TolQ/ExbB proton channel family protein [Veillonella sp.]
MFALNDALEESEMSGVLINYLRSKYTANISYNLPRVLGQCQNRNVLQSKMEDMVAHVYTHASRSLDWLSTIVTIAPLLGLLGTVTGMIVPFRYSVLTVYLLLLPVVIEALVATASDFAWLL